MGEINPLEAELARRTAKGWEIVTRQANEAQMRRPKHFSFLWAFLWFLVFGVGLIVYLVWHWAKRDHYAYLRLEGDRLVATETKGFLSTLFSPIAAYFKWAWNREKAWAKALALGGPVALVIVIIAVAAAAGGGEDGEPSAERPAAETQPTAGVAGDTRPTPEPAPETQRIVRALPGAEAEAEDVRVTLNGIVDPWVSDNQFIQPDPGKRFVAFDVTIQNTGESGTHHCNPFKFSLSDAEAFAYEATFGWADPSLNAVDLGSGQKTRGWVTFEVNEGTRLEMLKYDPGIFTTDDIEFQF